LFAIIVMATKPAPTRTTGPLHFEDLEPHRFEDLVRRLIYDFRTWRQLESTGRSGSDAGFDARGFEIISGATAPADNEEDEAAAAEVSPDRVWLIQCKREKSITPKKLGQYLDGLPTDGTVKLYGIVFAAACDFSKDARDLFRTTTQDMGLAEAYLWGKGELEDMLYQPKNDDVLFTFFGVSKRIRQRSLSDQVRRRLAVKRKAHRVLEGHGIDVLVRDAGDERYPYPDENETDKVRTRRWSIYRFENCRHDGLHVLWQRCLAFIDDDGVAWDYAEGMEDASPHNNPWRTEQEKQLIRKHDEARAEGMAVWDALPEKNRAWLQKWLVLPYENVIDIDEKGDDWFEGPHIYVADFDPKRGPFRQYVRVELATGDPWSSSRHAEANPKTRVAKFARMPKAGA
jgi:hypothetical protein